MKKYPVNKIHQLLEPGPVVLLTTFHHGKPNIMTIGFHMMIQHDPVLIGAIIGPWDYSYKALKATRECVIAIPGADLSKKVVDIGNCSGEEIDKFKTFRLGSLKAENVKAPLIEQCIANIECHVVDTRMVTRYNLFVFEAVKAWTNPNRKEKRFLHHRGDGTFSVDGRTIDLRERMVKWKDLVD